MFGSSYFESIKRILGKADAKGIEIGYCRSSEGESLFDKGLCFSLTVELYGRSYEIDDNGEIYIAHGWDGPYVMRRAVFRYRPEAVERLERAIELYDPEREKKRIHFYGLIRQYEGENDSVIDMQYTLLNLYAEKNGFSFKYIFGCKGGKIEGLPNEIYIECCGDEAANVRYVFEESVKACIDEIYSDPLSVIVVPGDRYDGYCNLENTQDFEFIWSKRKEGDIKIYPYKHEVLEEVLEKIRKQNSAIEENTEFYEEGTEHNEKKDLESRLEKYMNSKGITLEKLANRLGWSESALSNVLHKSDADFGLQSYMVCIIDDLYYEIHPESKQADYFRDIFAEKMGIIQ